MDFKRATKQQLQTYIQNELGLVPPEGYDKPELLAMIERERGGIPEINQTTKIAKPSDGDERKITLILHRGDDEMGDSAVQVTVNNYSWLVNRGMEVEVPYCVYEVLKNAIRTVHRQVTRPDGSSFLESRDVPSYPYTVVSGLAG